MAFKYQQVLPWGRSFDEYRRMFRLTEADLNQRILGCADGPANFNAEMLRLDHRVTSCDPLYRFNGEQIRRRIDATYEDVMKQTRQNETLFAWKHISSPEELGRLRMKAMGDFLQDYEQGRQQGRYVVGKLPVLPFGTGTFDLALCSHFLFFYSDSLSFSFHRLAMDELCRVAREIRIFPLLTYNGEPCPIVRPAVNHLEEAGHTVSVERVLYEFQRRGNMMLRITARNGPEVPGV